MATYKYFTKLQYFALFDFLSFFIIIGPTMLIIIASKGLDPHLKSNMVTIAPDNIVTVPYLLYKADRNITVTEYKILHRVRQGCGRHYIRSFIEQWDNGRMVTWAFSCIIFAVLAPVVSALAFLMMVPGDSLVEKLVPIIHLVVQISSLSCCLLGNFLLTKSTLCFLNYVWNEVPIQIILPVLSALICLTYKTYEIQITILFCKEHLIQWRTEEFIQTSPSVDIALLVSQLAKLNDDNDKDKDGTGSQTGSGLRMSGETDATKKSVVSSGSGGTSKVVVTLTAPK